MTLYLSHFFYTVNGGFMTVCIDGVLFLKFYLDFSTFKNDLKKLDLVYAGPSLAKQIYRKRRTPSRTRGEACHSPPLPRHRWRERLRHNECRSYAGNRRAAIETRTLSANPWHSKS